MHIGLLANHECNHMSSYDMLAFVPDGRECLTKGEQRGAFLNVGAAEPERTARPRLIVMDFIVVNLRRHERLHRDDRLLRVMRKMSGVIAANESGVRLAAAGGARRRDHNAAIETSWRSRPGWTRRGRAQVRAGGAVMRGNDEQVTAAWNYGGMSLVSKAITFEDHAGWTKTAATESHRDWSLPKRFAFNWNTTRRKRVVSAGKSRASRRGHAGSQMFVHRREARRRHVTG